jgi:hypothetical protein
MRLKTPARRTLLVLAVAVGFYGCSLSPNVDIPSVDSGDGDGVGDGDGDGDGYGSGGTSSASGGDSGLLNCPPESAGGAGGESETSGDVELIPSPGCEDFR